jgi:hypothetical protein
MRRWLVVATMLFVRGALAGDDAPPCPHPYFPMSEGLKLSYRAGKSEIAVSFSNVHGSSIEQRGTLHMSHKGRDGTAVATCSAEGIQTEFGGLEGAILSMSGLDVKVVASEGIAMPPPAQLVPGARWANTLSLELRPPSGSKIAFGVVRTKFRKESSVEGMERIEVAGRSWNALRVRNRITAMGGANGERTVESMSWIAPDAGLLRVKTGESVDFELIRIVSAPAVKKVAAPPTGRGASR